MSDLPVNENKKTVRKKNKLNSIDYTFMFIVLALVVYGLIMVFSASTASAYYIHGDALYFFKRQFAWAILGLILMFAISHWNYKNWYKYSVAIIGVTILLLILVMVAGKSINGAKRWLGVGPLTIQPSEIAKFALVIYMARRLNHDHTKLKSFTKGFLPNLAVICVISGLVIIEPHLSGALVILGVGLAMLYISGADLKHFGKLIIPLIAGVALLIVLKPYRMKRMISFLDPFKDASGDGYQVVQSLYAIGSGGLFGLGLGRSRQKFLYIPEPQNDFIFSILCEELGFFGALLMIILFALLIWRGIKIAMTSPDMFSSLTVCGIMAIIAIQVILNIAVVTSSCPCTGITLPFFSAGGTSLSIILAEMGVILNISRYCKKR